MRSVRRSATEDEELLHTALRRLRFRPLRNVRELPGSPDLVFPRARLAVFVDGDFWHGRTYFDGGLAPASNTLFWVKRFVENRRRDQRVDRILRSRGWSISRIWGSSIRKDPDSVARRIAHRLRTLSQ